MPWGESRPNFVWKNFRVSSVKLFSSHPREERKGHGHPHFFSGRSRVEEHIFPILIFLLTYCPFRATVQGGEAHPGNPADWLIEKSEWGLRPTLDSIHWAGTGNSANMLYVRDRTPGFLHARRALYHSATPLASIKSSKYSECLVTISEGF